jgi:hypothetical protein
MAKNTRTGLIELTPSAGSEEFSLTDADAAALMASAVAVADQGVTTGPEAAPVAEPEPEPEPDLPVPKLPIVGDTILVQGEGPARVVRVDVPTRAGADRRVRIPDWARAVVSVEATEIRHHRRVPPLPGEKYWGAAKGTWAVPNPEGFPISPFLALAAPPPEPVAPAPNEGGDLSLQQRHRYALERRKWEEAKELVAPIPTVGSEVLLIDHVTRFDTPVPTDRIAFVPARVTRVYDPGLMCSDLDLTTEIQGTPRRLALGQWSWPD